MLDIRVKVLVLCIGSLALLTSCSSSPTLEEQTKVTEYEACLDYVIAIGNQLTSTSGTSNKFTGLNLPETYNLKHNYEKGREFADVLQLCDEYRP
jgi:hypothetical protein